MFLPLALHFLRLRDHLDLPVLRFRALRAEDRRRRREFGLRRAGSAGHATDRGAHSSAPGREIDGLPFNYATVEEIAAEADVLDYLEALESRSHHGAPPQRPID